MGADEARRGGGRGSGLAERARALRAVQRKRPRRSGVGTPAETCDIGPNWSGPTARSGTGRTLMVSGAFGGPRGRGARPVKPSLTEWHGRFGMPRLPGRRQGAVRRAHEPGTQAGARNESAFKRQPKAVRCNAWLGCHGPTCEAGPTATQPIREPDEPDREDHSDEHGRHAGTGESATE